MIALRMLRAHAGLFGALGLTALVAGALVVGVPGYLRGATTQATRSGLGGLTGAAGGYRIDLDLAGDASAEDASAQDASAQDASAQDASVRAEIARVSSGAALEVSRTLQTEVPLSATVAGTRRSVIVESDPLLRADVRVIRGSWPASADQVAVQADGASALGLRVGDVLTVRRVTLRVAALWRARDPGAPRFLGDRAIRTGSDDGADGPIVLAPSVWARIGIQPTAVWTIVPDAPRSSPADLAALGRLDTDLPTALRASRLGATGVDASGDLPASARTVEARVTAVLGTAPVAGVVLAALLGLALVELGRLLVAARARETLLLRSRGASARRLTASAILEAGGISGVGAGLGGAASCLVSERVTGIGVPVWAAAAGAVLIGLVASIALGTAALGSARAILARDAVVRSGRGRRVAGLGLLALVGTAAVLSTLQFLRDGGPLDSVTDTSGTRMRLDPLAAPAPALALVAVALLAAVLVSAAVRVGARLTRRRDGMISLDTRRLSRSLSSSTTAVVLVTLASALLVVAASHAGTLDRGSIRNRSLLLGADVVASGASPDRLVAGARGVGGTTAFTAVRTVVVGSGTATLVGVPSAGVPTVMSDGDGLLDRRALARDVASAVSGPVLATGDTTLRGSIQSRGLAPTHLSARLLTADDTLLDAPARIDGDAFSIDLPVAGARLVAFDVTVPATDDPSPRAPLVPIDLELSAIRTESGPVDLGGAWTVPFVQPEPGRRAVPSGALGARLGTNSGSPTLVRLMPPGSRTAPVVITRSLAARTGLQPGSRVGLTDEGQTLPVRVRAVVEAVPGSAGPGALIDLGALFAAELRITEPPTSVRLWIGGGPGTADHDAAVVRARLPITAAVASVSDTADRDTVVSAAAALVAGTAGALVLAVLAVAAVLGAELRDRDGEVAVLRSLGRSGRRQARARTLESGAVLLWGLVLGVLGGAAVSALLVPDLARAAIAQPIVGLPVALRLDGVGLVAGILVLVAALAAVLLVTAARIRARADTVVVEESGR